MLSDIRLQRFRSYRDESFEFGPGVNIIVGPNASGKTNLLEALLVASRGSSYRAKDAELIAFGADWARIDTHGPETTRSIKLLPQNNSLVKKEFEVDNQTFTRLSLHKTLPVVLFEPDHLLLLSGSPDLRREFLDSLIEQVVFGYGRIRRDYRRALAQRNALLKHGPSAGNQLFAWNIRLSELGAQLAQRRHDLTEQLNAKLPALYQELSHTPATVNIRYKSHGDIEQYGSSLLQLLEKRQATDIERGFTSVGPHRDDLIVTFDGRDAAEVASRGETRTVLLALKILELALVAEARDARPLLLLDDVFSELDGARRKALTEVIGDYQTFITTTDADVVVHHFMSHCHIIPITKP